MIDDLDDTLRQLLIQRAGLDPTEVDISFEIPTQEWATPVTRPTVNLYLYDIRENLELRELAWDEGPRDNGRVELVRRPVRMNLSYMVTCWTSAMEDQHRLLWQVLETFFRNSPLPDELLQGRVKDLVHSVRTQVAQPDGILRNVSDFWGALENQLRPAINLVVILDLDLNKLMSEPITFARALRLGSPAANGKEQDADRSRQALEPGWEAPPISLGGVVHDEHGKVVEDASVRLLGRAQGRSHQYGPSIKTDDQGRYLMKSVPLGEYTLVVEAPGQPPLNHPLTLEVRAYREPLSPLVYDVEVPMGQ